MDKRLVLKFFDRPARFELDEESAEVAIKVLCDDLLIGYIALNRVSDMFTFFPEEGINITPKQMRRIVEVIEQVEKDRMLN